MEETKARLLLILKYGDICYAPGYNTGDGLHLIVTDPEKPIKVDDVSNFYTLISIFLSSLVANKIPEDNKQDARIVFKTVAYNDVTFVEEREVFEYQKTKAEREIEDLELADLFIRSNKDFLVPIPIIL